MKERLIQMGALTGAVWLAHNAFTTKQKKWIKDRDENQCQFPVSHKRDSYKNCGRDQNLEVHHVSPQRWSKEKLHWRDHEIDSPTNGITLCRQHHQDVVHGPDMPLARANYNRDKQSYKKAFRNRNELIAAGKKYWNDSWDHLFARIAVSRTSRFNRPWPEKRRRK